MTVYIPDNTAKPSMACNACNCTHTVTQTSVLALTIAQTGVTDSTRWAS